MTWTFTTPPPQIRASYPNDGPHPLEPVMFVAFDQGIDPAAVLKKVEVKAKAEAEEQTIAVRLATADEIEADKVVSRLAKEAGAGRWLAFRAEEPLPPDASVTVTVGAGTPSAEGPLTTTGGAELLLPHLRPAARHPELLRVGQRVPADDALVRRVQQSAG